MGIRACVEKLCILWNYVGGARLYRSQTARVNAPVQPLIASGPQFHLLVRGANLEPVRIQTGPGSGPIRGLRRHTVRHKQA
jgi:hypothetical protein